MRELPLTARGGFTGGGLYSRTTAWKRSLLAIGFSTGLYPSIQDHSQAVVTTIHSLGDRS